MTNYGTIPTTTSPSSPSHISTLKHRLDASLSTLRPWREFFSLHSLSLPRTNTLLNRIKANLSYFQMNYALTVLLIIFLGLLWNPISLIVFLVMMVAWLALYFLRDEPLKVFSWTVGDTTVVSVLGVLTVGGLLLTGAVWNVVGSIVVAVVVVLVHAALREREYMELDKEAGVLPPSS